MIKQNNKYQTSLSHYKSMLDNERKKLRTINSQRANYIYEKSDIEKLFLDCV